MRLVLKLSTTVVLFFVYLLAFSQEADIKRSNNTVSLNGKPYYIHIVRKNESLYAISKVYNVPVDTIKKDNLNLVDTLKINQYIKIRVVDNSASTKQEFIYHKVIKGDTPYNISVRYKVSVNDIYLYNPNAKLGIGIDEVLKIPVVTPVESVVVPQRDTTPKKIESTGFIIHKVQKKETIYGIAAKYKTSQDKIVALNPQLKDKGLQIDDELKIPITSDEYKSDNNYYYHKVEKKETIYSLTKQYNIKEKQLYKDNPDLKNRALQEGEFIKIQKNEITEKIEIEQEKKDSIIILHKEPERDLNALWKENLILPDCPEKTYDKKHTYKIAMFLPFYLNINDTLGKYIEIKSKDAHGIETSELVLRTMNIEDKLYSKSQLFIEFYQGALLALQNLKEKGISFEVQVFDTREDSVYTAKLLKDNNLSDYDLFIGPVFGQNLSIVGDYAWEHQINIVSPLSVKSDFIDHNPYAFQVSPLFEVQMQHASEFLNELDTKNYIIIHDGNNLDQDYIAQFKNQLFGQINEANFDQIKYNEVFYYEAHDSILKSVFTPNVKNIVIVPSSNQAFVTDVIGKLNAYTYTYDIMVFGQPRWQRFENIELENFHNTNTHIFTNSYIDYSKANVKQFVTAYRHFFRTEPDKYAFQGYDITSYFCTALNFYGKDFRKCIHMLDIDLLQTKFHFLKINDQGGYQNTAIYILEYTKDFKLKKVAEFPNK